MSVSVLEADFQCKHKIGNNNVFAKLRPSLFSLSAFKTSVSLCIMAPHLAHMIEMTPMDWSVSQL